MEIVSWNDLTVRNETTEVSYCLKQVKEDVNMLDFDSQKSPGLIAETRTLSPYMKNCYSFLSESTGLALAALKD